MTAPRPTLLLIPGLLCDARVWRDVAAALDDVCVPRVVEDLARFDTITAMAEAALEAAEGSIAVAGFSFGGRIAFEMIRRQPDRITHLAALDTGFGPAQPQEEASRMGLVRLARERGMDALTRVWLPPMLHESRRGTPLADELADMARRQTPQAFANQQRAALTRPDATPGLPAIAAPTLILVGRQDTWSPVAQHEALRDLIPGSRLSVIESCGHFAPAERPAEVAAAMRDWLAPRA